MDSRLFIEIGIDDNGYLAPIDRTPYERWEEDITYHAVIERVLDSNGEVVEARSKIMQHERDYENMRLTDPYKLPSDGLFTYQKILVPTIGHENGSSCYYDDGSFYINGSEVEFDELWNNKSDLSNVFWFDDDIFTIYNLVKCYVLTEKDRLDKVFKNGCKLDCSNNSNAANADFLASAIFVLNYLIDLSRFGEAQSILERLNTCNGICKDFRDSLNGCGCE